MARRTKIDRLPAETRELIGKWRTEGRTIREIHARLAELGVKLAVSTVALHTQMLDRANDQLRHSRAFTEALLDRVGAGDGSQLAGLNNELLHSAVMDILARAAAGDHQLGAKDIRFLAEAVAKLAQASKAEVDREIAIRRQVAEQAADEAGNVARSAGMTPELIERFRSAILGLGPVPRGKGVIR